MIGSRISSIFDRIRQARRVLDLDLRPVAHQHLVDDRRRGGDQIHVVLALQALLHDLQVQQAEEAAAEAEAQRLRGLRLVAQRRIVQVQLLQSVAQRVVLVGLDRVQPGEHLRLDLLEAGQRLLGRPVGQRDRVADLGAASAP